MSELSNINRKRIAFFGDSLTEGFPGVAYFDILEKALPDHELLNYGKGGDTVISIYRRTLDLQLDKPSDIAFLWIGTNDVFAKISWFYPILKTLSKQPWAANHAEFERQYHLLLKYLCRFATRVITVPPVFMGEDLHNKWNKEMGKLSGIIKKVSNSYDTVEFLDLGKIFYAKLEGKPLSNYLPKSAARVIMDVLLLQEDDQIDRKSRERGLHYTLDGVHLNSKGAEIVAEAFLEIIKNKDARSSI
jgi:lysophospholipase L1-like esterase